MLRQFFSLPAHRQAVRFPQISFVFAGILFLCATGLLAQEQISRQLGVPLDPETVAETRSDGRASVALGVPTSLILTLNSARFFRDSAYGRRVEEEAQAQEAVLKAENQSIEDELRAEELQLTARRADMEQAAFRILADAFDEKVQATRIAQGRKYDAIAEYRTRARQQFTEISEPILERIMVEVGAAAILEQSSVLMSAKAIDVTDLAIERLDQAFYDVLTTIPYEEQGDGFEGVSGDGIGRVDQGVSGQN